MKLRKNSFLRSCLGLGAAVFAFAALTSITKAVPYASGITTNGNNIHFILNEAADNVKVVFNGGASSQNLGALAKGSHSFALGAATSYRIEVTKSTAPTWTQISDDLNPLVRFYGPRGVAVNQRPNNLSLFGRVYVASTQAGTTTATPTASNRTTGKGIYVLKADLTDALGQGDTEKTGGIAFDANVLSPFKIEVGEDNNLYIGDFSNNSAGVFRTDPNVDNGEVVLDQPGLGNSTVHTTCNGSPVAKGSLAGGNLTLWAIDGQWPGTGNRNRLLRWDIGSGPLPHNNPPAAQLGTAGNGSTSDVQSDLDIAPDGKFFVMQHRAAGTPGTYDPNRINLRVYATDGTTLLWDSLAQSLSNGLTTDLMVLARAVKVSPSGKHVAIIRNDTQVLVVGMTNGIPDFTKTNLVNVFGATSATSTTGREVGWDAAGNLYAANTTHEKLRVWSPGGTTTAVTDSAGTFQILTPAAEVSVTAPDNFASEPGSNTGTFTITRGGDTAGALTVFYTLGGTATNGVDYVNLPGSITFAPGATSTNITVTPIDDAIAEFAETVILSLSGNTNYSVIAPASATVTIHDDETPELIISATRPTLLECYSPSRATFQVSRKGRTNDVLTANISYSGTATAGSDFTGPATVNIAAGVVNQNFTIAPVNDNLVEGEETAIANIAAGAGYTIGTPSAATAFIKDDDTSGNQLFADNFDTDTSANWTVNRDDGGFDTFADFFYDYSADGIPASPNSSGTTRGLKFRVNESLGAVNGMSASPISQNFTGDYRLKFDAWINFNGPLAAGGTGSTEHFSAGIGTSGTVAVWPNGASDGGWFAASGDGGTTSDYRAYINNELQVQGSGAYAAGTGVDAWNNLDPYYNLWGGLAAPAAQTNAHPQQTGSTSAGTMGFAWHCVHIVKEGEVVTWLIDGVKIASITNTVGKPFNTQGNIFVGYFDPFASISDNAALSFGLFDNVRVETLSAPPATVPNITSVQIIGGTSVQINFTGGTSDTPSSFTLQSAVNDVTGPYTPDGSASIIQVSPGVFRATATFSAAQNRFYRILRN